MTCVCRRERLDDTADAVSQSAVAKRSGLTPKVVSYWLISMSDVRLVERGPAEVLPGG